MPPVDKCNVSELLQPLKDVSFLKSVDDQDPAALIWYSGTEPTATVDIGVANADAITLVQGTDPPTIIDLTNSASDESGEVQDLVNALPGWNYKRQAARRDHALYSGGSINVITFAATDAKVLGGVQVNWDTSAIQARRGLIGAELLTVGLDGDVVPAGARDSNKEFPYVRDPIKGNTQKLDRNDTYGSELAAIVLAATAQGSYATGNAQWNLTKCTNKSDGEEIQWIDSDAPDGVTSELGVIPLGPRGFQNSNGWIVVEFKSSVVEAITSSYLSIDGVIARLL